MGTAFTRLFKSHTFLIVRAETELGDLAVRELSVKYHLSSTIVAHVSPQAPTNFDDCPGVIVTRDLVSNRRLCCVVFEIPIHLGEAALQGIHRILDQLEPLDVDHIILVTSVLYHARAFSHVWTNVFTKVEAIWPQRVSIIEIGLTLEDLVVLPHSLVYQNTLLGAWPRDLSISALGRAQVAEAVANCVMDVTKNSTRSSTIQIHGPTTSFEEVRRALNRTLSRPIEYRELDFISHMKPMLEQQNVSSSTMTYLESVVGVLKDQPELFQGSTTDVETILSPMNVEVWTGRHKQEWERPFQRLVLVGLQDEFGYALQSQLLRHHSERFTLTFVTPPGISGSLSPLRESSGFVQDAVVEYLDWNDFIDPDKSSNQVDVMLLVVPNMQTRESSGESPDRESPLQNSNTPQEMVKTILSDLESMSGRPEKKKKSKKEQKKIPIVFLSTFVAQDSWLALGAQYQLLETLVSQRQGCPFMIVRLPLFMEDVLKLVDNQTLSLPFSQPLLYVISLHDASRAIAAMVQSFPVYQGQTWTLVSQSSVPKGLTIGYRSFEATKTKLDSVTLVYWNAHQMLQLLRWHAHFPDAMESTAAAPPTPKVLEDIIGQDQVEQYPLGH